MCRLGFRCASDRFLGAQVTLHPFSARRGCCCLRPENRGSFLAFLLLCSKCFGVDCYGTYFRHAQTCDSVRVPSATEWTATVHTLHMPKLTWWKSKDAADKAILEQEAIIGLFINIFSQYFQIMCWWNDVWSANKCLKLKMRCFLPALLLRVAKNHCFTTTRAWLGVSTTLKKRYGFLRY